jgi:hypothetical protein
LKKQFQTIRATGTPFTGFERRNKKRASFQEEKRHS